MNKWTKTILLIVLIVSVVLFTSYAFKTPDEFLKASDLSMIKALSSNEYEKVEFTQSEIDIWNKLEFEIVKDRFPGSTPDYLVDIKTEADPFTAIYNKNDNIVYFSFVPEIGYGFLSAPAQSGWIRPLYKTEASEALLSMLRIEKEHHIKHSDSLAERKYINDPKLDNYIYTSALSGGYYLDYRIYTGSNSKDTFQTIFLMKDGVEIKDLNGGSDFGLPQKNIGYIGADFSDVFVFVQSFGSGNPHHIQLVEKSSGEFLREGVWVDVETENEILLYIENYYDDNDQLKIYDHQNKNEILVNDFNDSKCAKHSIAGLRNCVSIDTVTKGKIVLEINKYYGFDDEYLRKEYLRK